MHPFKWSYNIIICHTIVSPSFGEKKSESFQAVGTYRHFLLWYFIFWVYDLFTFYKYMKTMAISDVSLQNHCINVIFRIQRFYKGILSNHNNERSHSEQFLDRNIKELDWNGHTMFLKWHTMLFISDCHWGSNLIVLLCYSHILFQGLHHCLWLPLNWYY